MTAVPVNASLANDGGPALISRGAFDLDWPKVLKFGSLLAMALMFIALAGMPVGLDRRVIIDPFLSMGDLSLLWLPVLLGYAVGSEKVLEGMAATRKGVRDLVAGGMVGLMGGAGLAVLILLIDNFDLRDPLVNWSPQLLAVLTDENSIGYGIAKWLILGTILGLIGASFHLMAPIVRDVITKTVLTVLGFSIFETIISDLLKGFKLDFIDDLLYAKQGGLKLASAIGLAVVAALATIVGRGRVKQARANLDAKQGADRTRANTILILIAAALLIILPLFLGKITNELLANVGIFLLLALGLNIVVGIAGILDLGYVAFFAVGGYTTAVLTSTNRGENWDTVPFIGFKGEFPFIETTTGVPTVPWMIALIFVVLMAALVGLFIGAPVIRMRGDYLAIVTLGFGEIIRILFLSDWLKGWFGGAQGITNIPGAGILGLASVKGTDPRAVFYLVLFFSAIAIYVSWRLENSRLGRAWMAIREDESVAEAMGINTVTTKLMAFVVGAVLASFSGAVFAAKVGSIFPTSFLILVSIIILVVVIVGGMGNIAGIIAGSVVLIGILGGPKQPGLFAEFAEYKLLIYGALLVWMMLKRPEGLIPNVRRSRELHQDEFLQDAWLKGEIDQDDEDLVDDAVSGLASQPGVAPA